MHWLKSTLGGTLAVALLGTFAGTAAAQAPSRQHIDRLAVQLQRQLSDLHKEVDAHFRATAQYRELDRDVAEMERLAAHIHEVVDRGGGLGHIRADVGKLHRLVHHVEGQVEGIARSGQIGRRTLAHLRVAVERVASTVHHLEEELH